MHLEYDFRDFSKFLTRSSKKRIFIDGRILKYGTACLCVCQQLLALEKLLSKKGESRKRVRVFWEHSRFEKALSFPDGCHLQHRPAQNTVRQDSVFQTDRGEDFRATRKQPQKLTESEASSRDEYEQASTRFRFYNTFRFSANLSHPFPNIFTAIRKAFSFAPIVEVVVEGNESKMR